NNEVTAGGPIHFIYVGTMSGWRNVQPQGGLGYPSVRFVRYDDFNSSLAVFPTADGGYRFYSDKGREFTITFNNVPEGASFDMSETPYGPGESFDTAIEVNGNFNIKATPGTYWYKYEPGKSQFLNISTDLKFGFGEGPVEGYMSGIYVYLNNLENYEPMPANWLTGEISAMNKTITADDVLYFEVGLKDLQNDVNINIRARDPFPGEVYDNPIPIENKGNPTVVAFPAIELNNVGRWYSIDLVPGTLEMIAGESITIQVYPSYNTEYEIAHAGWLKYDRETNVTYYGFGHGNTTYYPALEVKDAGTYLLKVREIRNACDITLSGSALGDSNGVESVLANPDFNVTAGTGEIRVTGNADVKVYSVDGAMVASKAVSGIATIEVAPGIYLVQANGQSVKVAVK
ncbi:MAG: hypothetical protein K2K36_08995, partial [Muribaculaceae bacterium]|nr:hypothetical protein [Muribaculaceae bacterium]